jgi:esterase
MLNYRVFGDLQQKPLVVLHGLLGSLENWYTFARNQETQRGILAIDLRNHGHSPHVEGMSFREMANDVIEVLDSLYIRECDLMGHSMGGKVAMQLALHYPAQFLHLIVVDIAPKSYPPRHQALLQAMLSMPLAELSSRKQADEWLAPTVKQPFERGFLLKNLARHSDGHFYWQCNLSEIVKHYLKISSFPQQHTQSDLPTLFIKGGQSDYISEEDLSLISAYFANAQLEVIPTAGHLPHVQTPEPFTQLVTQFLAA